jgi:arginine repressor
LNVPELVGTLAGDDTVFCAVATSEAGKRLLALIKEKI